MSGTSIWTGANAAQTDGNQNPTVMMVAGTLGTSDTKGTSAPIRWAGNPATGAGYMEILAGGVGGGTTVTVDHGTITLSNPAGTTNNIATGTLQTLGTVGVVQSGTINAATAILNSGTINVGTFVNNGGTVAVIQNAGTIAAGANIIGNVGTLISGTINSATAVLNSGTINVGTFVANGGTIGQVTSISSLTTGSIVVIGFAQSQLGTLNSGTINAGTVTASFNPKPVVNTIVSAGTTTNGTIGTLVAAQGVGTTSYITGFHVLAVSGTPEVLLSYGLQATGAQVIARGVFPAGGGIARDKTYPHGYGTTNSAVTFNVLSGSGTVSWSVDYFNAT